MRCPKCDSENNDGAKFCKKCGTLLQKKAIDHESMINTMSEKSDNDNTTKYIIIALAVIAVVLAGAFVYIYGFGGNQSQDSSAPVIQNNTTLTVQNNSADVSADVSDSEKTATKTSSSSSSKSSSDMSIKGGSFQTSGGLEDLTYASIYVGPEHSGEKVTIQIFYSRDGSSLNDGNMVPKTVDSSGYINVRSAEAYKYFPDYAEINLYDSSGNNLLDSQSVSLSPESGTQTF